MERRRFLSVIGTGSAAGLVGLAGCGSPGDDTGGTPGEAGAGETPGAGAEDTPTEAETATPGADEDTEPPGTDGETETPGADGETDDGTQTPGEDGDEAGADGGDGGQAAVSMITDGETYYFDPIGVYVEPGTEVTWVNESGSHSSTAYTEDNPQSEVRLIPEDAEGWDSGIISEEGSEFSHTFETEGTYDYYCTPHKSLDMVGRIVVGSPGGPAEGGQPPDGDVPDSGTIADQGSVAYDEFSG